MKKQAKIYSLFLITVFLMALIVPIAGAVPQAESETINVLVGFVDRPDVAQIQRGGGQVYREFSLVPVVAARMAPQAAEILATHSNVRYVEPDSAVHALDVAVTASIQSVPWGINRVFGEEKHPFATWNSSTGSGMGLAVLDTGIDKNHVDLAVAGGTNTIDGTDWGTDGYGHGTHVAGSAAALENTWGVVGVSPAVNLYAVKVLNDSGSGSVSSVVAGIEWAVTQGIPVLNISLGSDSHSQTLQDAVDAAYREGHLLIASAGNSGNPDGTGNSVSYPARYESVIAVAASDTNDRRAGFSSTGPAVELIAPGVSIQSTYPGDGYTMDSGTSMASPHVAGVAALTWAANPELTNQQVREILQTTAEDLGLAVDHQGFGLVRADLAVAAALGVQPPTPTAYAVSGTVIDADTGVVIEGATITVKGTGQTATTDGEGRYTIPDVAKGTYDLTAATDGYSPVTKTVTVNTDTNVDFALNVIPVNRQMDVVVDTGGPYQVGDWVSIYVMVTDTDTGNAVGDADVTVIITNPGGGVASENGTTNSDGLAKVRWKSKKRDPSGTYTVTVDVTKYGYDHASGSGMFEIQ